MSGDFTDQELVTIAFLASERTWRARLAAHSPDPRVPARERAAFTREIEACESIVRKVDAARRAAAGEEYSNDGGRTWRPL